MLHGRQDGLKLKRKLNAVQSVKSISVYLRLKVYRCGPSWDGFTGEPTPLASDCIIQSNSHADHNPIIRKRFLTFAMIFAFGLKTTFLQHQCWLYISNHFLTFSNCYQKVTNNFCAACHQSIIPTYSYQGYYCNCQT